MLVLPHCVSRGLCGCDTGDGGRSKLHRRLPRHRLARCAATDCRSSGYSRLPSTTSGVTAAAAATARSTFAAAGTTPTAANAAASDHLPSWLHDAGGLPACSTRQAAASTSATSDPGADLRRVQRWDRCGGAAAAAAAGSG